MSSAEQSPPIPIPVSNESSPPATTSADPLYIGLGEDDRGIVDPDSATVTGATDSETEHPLSQLATVPCEDISGIAGSGKTYLVREKIEDDPTWGLLCATTGIAAVNLGTVTLNSALGFFDTNSLCDSYLTGMLTRRIRKIGEEYRRIVIDERSMLDAAQLDMIYNATKEANEFRAFHDHPLGITLVGDFAQLPPVKAKFCFEAECWPEFAANTLRLTKVWRQEQAHFLDALNATRRGDGGTAADILSSWGTEWHTSLDTDFDGTTIVPKNDQVDRYNGIALDKVPGSRTVLTSRRWGKATGEWRNIPERLDMKVGAYVMILANSQMTESHTFEYVNGDCGHVREITPDMLRIKLVRNDRTITLERLTRDTVLRDKPDGWHAEGRTDSYQVRQHRNMRGGYVVGQVEFWPVRLAYASTIHKSQGLSLDRIQFDFRNQFSSQPAMMYVALSRCRTIEGLRLVGQVERFVKNCTTDIRVTPWL